MCLAIPGKVLKIEGKKAMVDFSGVVMDVNIELVDVKVGDFVDVYGGCAIEKRKNADNLRKRENNEIQRHGK